MKNQIGQVNINVYKDDTSISVEVEGFPDDSDATLKIMSAAQEAVMKHFIAKAKENTQKDNPLKSI